MFVCLAPNIFMRQTGAQVCRTSAAGKWLPALTLIFGMITGMTLFTFASSAFAQEKPPEGLFFYDSLQCYAVPGIPLKTPSPGIRHGGGLELCLWGPGSVALGLETGWSHTGALGRSRPADKANFVPLMFRGGYSYPLNGAFLARADILLGGIIVLAGNEAGFVPAAGIRFMAEYRLSKPEAAHTWNVFAGAGADVVPQQEGIVALPHVEAGIKLRLNSAAAPLTRAGEREAVYENVIAQEEAQMPHESAPAAQEAAPAENAQMPLEDAPLQETRQEETPSPEEAQAEDEAPQKTTPQEDAQLAQIPREAAAPVEIRQKASVVLRNLSLHFLGDITDLSTKDYAALEEAAEFLRGHPKSRVVVAGHAAMAGSVDGRMTVSRQRARNVADWLVRHGVAAERVEQQAYGAERPIATNDTYVGREMNRRVELTLIAEEGEIP